MFPCLSAIAIFLKTVYSFLSAFFQRFAGCFLLYLKYSVYFRNINPLFIYVTNIFFSGYHCQTQLILHFFFLFACSCTSLFLSNQVYKSFPLDFETYAHSSYIKKFTHIFSSTCFIFTFRFLVHLEFILMTSEKKILLSFPTRLGQHHLLESLFPQLTFVVSQTSNATGSVSGFSILFHLYSWTSTILF